MMPPFSIIVHQVPSYSPPTHLFLLNYLVWIIYILDMLKEKRKKFLYTDVNWKVLSTAKCILKINPNICEILGGRSALPPPLKSPMITQQPTQKAGPVLKPLRCSQNQCWADGIRITGVFTKYKSVGCTTGDSESVGLRKESREGGKKKVNK